MAEEQTTKLTDLIDLPILQKIQDTVAISTGMAAIITDANGEPVTTGKNFTEYCSNYMRCSEIGLSMCTECDRFGVSESVNSGHLFMYNCHSGLVDFSAPIIADGKVVGGIVGGQVLTSPLDEDYVRNTADQLELDADSCLETAKKIPVLKQEEIDRASETLQSFAEVLSEMAHSRAMLNKANSDIEHAAKLQGDFLANMSHEIRTPMNAVVGFAELALREDISTSARDYINHIKSSSKALLNIINDILDYSKIESGKMDIIPVVYEPLSLIDDISSISMTRLLEKDVELIVDVDPNIPTKLEGDNLRLRQILINLCNNATKFTEQGYVKIRVTYEWANYQSVNLKFEIIDTGIGIKEEDFDRIFDSFQQVDSKRNRNIEGSGLGLAICNLLLKLMNSKMEVQSEYGKGSVFSFVINQRVVDAKPTIVLNDDDKKIAIAGVFSSQYVADQFVSDSKKLGLFADTFLKDSEDNKDKLFKWIESPKVKNKDTFFFIEQSNFIPQLMGELREIKNLKPVLIAETFADIREWAADPDLLILRKPISVINLGNLFNHKELRYRDSIDTEDIYDFQAEHARILVVDDNIVNLTVARGLLEPTKALIDLASSGKEALQMIRQKKYDLIFMDHMMPNMDGIETTRIIRKEYPNYEKTAIIALTANAMSGVREMFISEGMNDFVPKPIEVRILIEKVKHYLPAEKISKGTVLKEIKYNFDDKDKLVIADLDTETSIELLGSESLYMSVLKIYYESIESKAQNIENLFNEENWPKYTVEVHALKSASKQIGATALGDMAFNLEMAGKNLDLYTIKRDTLNLLEKYRSYMSILAPYFDEKGTDNIRKEATRDDLKPLFDELRDAIDNLDMDKMESIIDKLDGFDYPEMWIGKMKALKNAVKDMDVDECIDVLDSWN